MKSVYNDQPLGCSGMTWCLLHCCSYNQLLALKQYLRDRDLIKLKLDLTGFQPCMVLPDNYIMPCLGKPYYWACTSTKAQSLHTTHREVPEAFTTYNSVSRRGWKEGSLVFDEEEILTVSAELSGEVVTVRILHSGWELHRPKHVTQGWVLRLPVVTPLNRHPDSQHFSISD